MYWAMELTTRDLLAGTVGAVVGCTTLWITGYIMMRKNNLIVCSQPKPAANPRPGWTETRAWVKACGPEQND